jgi:hypothetical protein
MNLIFSVLHYGVGSTPLLSSIELEVRHNLSFGPFHGVLEEYTYADARVAAQLTIYRFQNA